MIGQSKLCAISFESMVEFSMISLEMRDVQECSRMVKEKNSDDEVKKSYSIAIGCVHVLGGEKLVACDV